MAKASQAAGRQLNRKHAVRRAKAARTRATLLAGTAIVLILSLGIIGFGLYRERVLVPGTPVATVNGEIIRASEYHKRLRLQRLATATFLQDLQRQASQATDEQSRAFYQTLIASSEQQLSALPYTTLEELIEERLVAREAARRGIQLSEEEIDPAVRARLGFADPDTPEDAPEGGGEGPAGGQGPAGEDDARFQEVYTEYLATLRRQAGMSQRDFRAMVRADLLQERLEEALRAEIPERAQHVYVKHIQVSTAQDALQALGRISGGETFEDVARQVSTDPATRERGGDLGWTPVGIMGEAFDAQALQLDPGQISQPVAGRGGFHILKGVARPEELQVDGQDRQALAAQAYRNWLDRARAEASIQRSLTTDLIP